MAASGDPTMHRMQPTLPTAYGLSRCPPVLEEMQRTFWLEHSMDLRSAASTSGMVHKRIAGQNTVHRSVRQVEPGTVESHLLDAVETLDTRGSASRIADSDGSTTRISVTSAG